MTADKQFLAGLLARLSAAYPSFTLDDETCREYARALEGLRGECLAFAVDEAVRTSRWFPSIAQLRELADMKARDLSREDRTDMLGGRCSVCGNKIMKMIAKEEPLDVCKHGKTTRVVRHTTKACCGDFKTDIMRRICAPCIFEVIAHGTVTRGEVEDRQGGHATAGEARAGRAAPS